MWQLKGGSSYGGYFRSLDHGLPTITPFRPGLSIQDIKDNKVYEVSHIRAHADNLQLAWFKPN